jgi:hypothetical protein
LTAGGKATATTGLGSVQFCEKLWLGLPFVDPGPLQFIAQQSRAAATCGASLCSIAFLQQSIIAGSPLWEGSGVPAATPAARAQSNRRFVSFLNTAKENLSSEPHQVKNSIRNDRV